MTRFLVMAGAPDSLRVCDAEQAERALTEFAQRGFYGYGHLGELRVWRLTAEGALERLVVCCADSGEFDDDGYADFVWVIKDANGQVHVRVTIMVDGGLLW